MQVAILGLAYCQVFSTSFTVISLKIRDECNVHLLHIDLCMLELSVLHLLTESKYLLRSVLIKKMAIDSNHLRDTSTLILVCVGLGANLSAGKGFKL